MVKSISEGSGPLCACGCGRLVEQHEGKGRTRLCADSCNHSAQERANGETQMQSSSLQDGTLPRNTILPGDAHAVLKSLPDAFAQMCITSPPYYRQREYLPANHADKLYEIGREETPQQYVDHLVAVFREVRQGHIYQAAHFRLVRENKRHVQTYARMLRPLTEAEQRAIAKLSAEHPRSRRYHAMRAVEHYCQHSFVDDARWEVSA
jgi:hypothetical protein